MSIETITSYRLKCDGCGKLFRSYGVVVTAVTTQYDAQYLRDLSRWLYRDGKDFCPRCKAEKEGK